MTVFAPPQEEFVPLKLQNQWKMFIGQGIDDKFVPYADYTDSITMPDGNTVAAQDLIMPENGKFDLNIICGERAPAGTPAVLVNLIQSDDGRPMQIGVGVDWWFTAYLNGEQLYSTLESGGNQNAVPEKTDHVFNLPIKKGRNILTLLTLAGSSTRKHAIGAVPFRDLTPKTAELRSNPYIVNPVAGGCTIRFSSQGAMAGGIMLRKKGESSFVQKWQTFTGILRRDLELHSITVDGLEPDAVYEFKVLLQYTDTNAVHELPQIYSFTAPGGNGEFSCFISGDTQLMPEHRHMMTEKLFSFPGAAKTDFFIHIGDAGSTFNNFEPDYFDGLMDVFANHTMPRCPIYIPLRGNHEFYGRECTEYVRYFGTGNEETFQAFRQGDTFFLILDSGPEGSSGPFAKGAYIFIMWEEYWRKQCEFVRKVVESEEFKYAKFRVVFSHATPAMTTEEWCTSSFAESILKEHKIHLWMGGHVHAYRRTIPQTSSYWTNQPEYSGKPLIPGDKFNYPVITIDGPHATGTELSGSILKCTDNYLELVSFSPDGRIFDHIRIDEKGNVSEIENDLHKIL